MITKSDLRQVLEYKEQEFWTMVCKQNKRDMVFKVKNRLVFDNPVYILRLSVNISDTLAELVK